MADQLKTHSARYDALIRACHELRKHRAACELDREDCPVCNRHELDARRASREYHEALERPFVRSHP